METTEDRLMPVKDAAVHAGVHRNTISRWIAEGRLTKYTIRDRFVRVDVSELDRLTTAVRTGEDS